MTHWLVTSTFYGQWLPGDPRGSVTNVRDRRPSDRTFAHRQQHDRPGDEYEPEIPGLQAAARDQLKGPPVSVDLPQAEQLLDQFLETGRYRGWIVHAVSIMFNHIHVVIETPPEAGKKTLLRDLKSYGSRRLNQFAGERLSVTWWSDGGSCRPVRNVPAAIFYVCHRQPNPLVVWSRIRGRIPPSESHPSNRFPGGSEFDEIYECEPPR